MPLTDEMLKWVRAIPGASRSGASQSGASQSGVLATMGHDTSAPETKSDRDEIQDLKRQLGLKDQLDKGKSEIKGHVDRVHDAVESYFNAYQEGLRQFELS